MSGYAPVPAPRESLELLAAYVEQQFAAIAQAYNPDYIEFTPLWTAETSGTPSAGDGTFTGFLTRLPGWDVVAVKLQIGAGYAGGVGDWSFTLPEGLSVNAFGDWYGTGWCETPSTTGRLPVMPYLTHGNNNIQCAVDGFAGDLDAVSPGGWANGSRLYFQLAYKPDSE